jgi:hypothetical protein
VRNAPGPKIACAEEVAYHMGYIDCEWVPRLAKQFCKGNFWLYLEMLAVQWPSVWVSDIYKMLSKNQILSGRARCQFRD